MKSFFKNRYNIIFIFLFLVAFFSVFSFFSYQIQPLKEKMPKKIHLFLQKNLLKGEAIFLNEEFLDLFVLKYPKFNIYPAGGKEKETALSKNDFYLLSCYFSPDFNFFKDFKHKRVAFQDGCSLFFLIKKGVNFKEIKASSFLKKFKVSSFYFPNGSKFDKEGFKTGLKHWQKIKIDARTFAKKKIEAIDCHPLDKEKKIFITIPKQGKKFDEIVFEEGVADSGKYKGSKPVKILIFQGNLRKTFFSKDGVWQKIKLKDFDSTKEIHLEISTKDDGKRHFYFDIVYRERIKNDKK